MNTSNLSCSPALRGADAPDRCTERQRRLVKVKFMALPEPEPHAPPASTLGFLSRFLGFLAAARR